MKYIVLSDTHFGVKNNSITWMNSQLGFIYKEFIPYIQSLKNKGEKVKFNDFIERLKKELYRYSEVTRPVVTLF